MFRGQHYTFFKSSGFWLIGLQSHLAYLVINHRLHLLSVRGHISDGAHFTRKQHPSTRSQIHSQQTPTLPYPNPLPYIPLPPPIIPSHPYPLTAPPTLPLTTSYHIYPLPPLPTQPLDSSSFPYTFVYTFSQILVIHKWSLTVVLCLLPIS